MKTKVCVNNDRRIPMNLQVQSYQPAIPGEWRDNSTYHKLGLGEARVFEIEIPEGSIPYIKIWETGQALLSWYPDKEMKDEEI